MTTSIRLRPSLRDQVDHIAARERRNRNNWLLIQIEDAVERYLAEHPDARLPVDQDRPS